jgi:hypothetical protein
MQILVVYVSEHATVDTDRVIAIVLSVYNAFHKQFVFNLLVELSVIVYGS